MKAYVFLVLVMILFSGNILVGKAINDLPPFTITFFRCLIAFMILLPIGWVEIRKMKHVFTAEWKPLVGLALTGVAFFNVFVYSSLQFTSSTNVAIVEATTPVFTVALGILFLRETLNQYQWIGVIISLIGALWVITQGSWEVVKHLQFNVGDVLMIGGIFVWAVYSILVKQHNSKFPVYGGLVVMFVIALLALFPFALVEWLTKEPNLLDPGMMLGLVYLGVFPSVIALLLYTKAVKEIGPSRASIFFNLLPVFTIVGAVLFLGEQIVIEQIIGATLVIVGVYLSTQVKAEQKESSASVASKG